MCTRNKSNVQEGQGNSHVEMSIVKEVDMAGKSSEKHILSN